MARSDGSDLLPKKRAVLLDRQPVLRALYGHVLPDDVLLLDCQDCGYILPLNHFSRNAQRLYGVVQTCRTCRRSKRNNLDCPPDPTITEKRCRVCRQTKPIAAFAHSRRHSDGYLTRCRRCDRDRKNQATAMMSLDTVRAYRREQTIRLSGQLGIDCPTFDIKQCSRCQYVFTPAAFSYDFSRADWLHSNCEACRRGTPQQFTPIQPEINP